MTNTWLWLQVGTCLPATDCVRSPVTNTSPDKLNPKIHGNQRFFPLPAVSFGSALGVVEPGLLGFSGQMFKAGYTEESLPAW